MDPMILKKIYTMKLKITIKRCRKKNGMKKKSMYEHFLITEKNFQFL